MRKVHACRAWQLRARFQHPGQSPCPCLQVPARQLRAKSPASFPHPASSGIARQCCQKLALVRSLVSVIGCKPAHGLPSLNKEPKTGRNGHMSPLAASDSCRNVNMRSMAMGADLPSTAYGHVGSSASGVSWLVMLSDVCMMLESDRASVKSHRTCDRIWKPQKLKTIHGC